MIVGLPEKEVLRAYLTQRNLKHRHQKKFFRLYDYYITEKNIRRFFFRSAKLFVYALVTNRLDDIEDYVPIKEKKINVSRESKKRNAR